jgi:hypothetical protein
MLYSFFQNFWTPIWILGSFILLHTIPWWIQYRQGRYVLEHYPVRYQNQLTSSRNNRRFPFNFGGYYRTSLPIKHLPKIIEIAKQENDVWLENSAKNLRISFYFFWYLYIIILLYKIILH